MTLFIEFFSWRVLKLINEFPSQKIGIIQESILWGLKDHSSQLLEKEGSFLFLWWKKQSFSSRFYDCRFSFPNSCILTLKENILFFYCAKRKHLKLLHEWILQSCNVEKMEKIWNEYQNFGDFEQSSSRWRIELGGFWRIKGVFRNWYEAEFWFLIS